MTIRRAFRGFPKNAAELDRLLRDLDLPNNEITNSTLRDSTALSVIGRSVNSTGDPADIVASSDNTLLVRRSSALGFGPLIDGDISAEMMTQHMEAIRSFLPPRQSTRAVDDSQAIIAAQVFS